MLEQIRHSLRGKLVRVVEDAFGPRYEASLNHAVDRVVSAIQEAEHRSRRDLEVAADSEAVASSARFALEQMPTAPVFHHPQATLEHALELAPTSGMALEFGVHTGHTLEVISKAREGQLVFGFDSFRGLPQDWRTHFPAGTFHLDSIPDVPGARLVAGWFEETLPEFLAQHDEPVDFVHVDSDLYSSARTVLEHVGPRLYPGSVLVFDEYFNYPGWQRHEHKAWLEFVAASGVGFRYEAYTANNEQVVVSITDVPGQKPDGSSA
ncbi:hypothetical protein FHU38_001612 [Saccharomonospora amisosensis]|uniref:Methyltransferase family protein n=1 Tax=Saccharomonospora amisosensis TaxID=1128677 RepID=A0A7X5UNH0_9PSEU|nr:class I SAM-dependent methyltransferase [Saccharomonospora amisosensis]NIJ11268.1 hypothetical protein [Saccharomonospora amisosensis]